MIQIPKPPDENSDGSLTADFTTDLKPSKTSPEAPDPPPPPPTVTPSQPPEGQSSEKSARLPPTELDTAKMTEKNEVQSPLSLIEPL